MSAVKYYTDTVVECEIAKIRRKSLLEKKEEIYTKYFGLKSPKTDGEAPQPNTKINKDKMIMYLNEVEVIEHNGTTLKQDIDAVESEIKRLEGDTEEMERMLAKLDGIESRLYYEIVINKKKVTEAINYISETCHISVQSLWKTYYPKISKDINRLRKYKKVE